MHYPKDSYITENAKEEGQNPREKLMEFVKNHQDKINRDAIKSFIPNLNMADEIWVNEFVKVNNPYTILETYFYSARLKGITVNKRQIARDEIDVVGAILHELGFKKKIEPSGLFHIKEELNRLKDNPKNMAAKVEEILKVLILFYSFIMRDKATDGYGEISYFDNDTEKAVDSINEIEQLIKKFRTQRVKPMGELYNLLKELMLLIQNTAGFSNYCDLHFQFSVPLTQSQIAEIGMFRTYRNLIVSGHDVSWDISRKRGKDNLDEMDRNARDEWENNWDHVVHQYDHENSLPEEDMVLRMANFFEKFINLLSEKKIYPKVIVMRDYQVDAYGTTIINAVTSDPNETIVLTDWTNFDPFSEFYYNSRTNPIGINPILVSKLELDEWGTIPPKENQQEQENS